MGERKLGRRAVLAGIVTIGGVAAVELSEPSSGEAAGTAGTDTFPVLSGQLTAAQLIDSVGVNAHLDYTDTAYGAYDEVVRPRLLESGIRHVRDRLVIRQYAAESLYYARLRDLGAQGVGFLLISDVATAGTPATDHSALGDVQRWAEGHVEAFEGINEPGNRDLGDWAAEVRANQIALFDGVRADASLAGVKVVAASALTPEDAAEMGDLGPWSDYGNIHNYTGDTRPETDVGPGHLAYQTRDIGAPVAPDKPLISTESGYFTSPNQGGGRADSGLSERAAGIYTPRMLLHHVANGIPRTYIYELLDQSYDPSQPEANFGLLRTDGSPRPAFYAVSTLLGLMQPGAAGGSGAPAAPGGPQVAWEATGAVEDLAQVPIRVTDDVFYLAVWRNVDVWDSPASQDLPLQPREATITAAGYRLDALVRQADDGAFVLQPADGPTIAVDGSVTLLRFQR